jgi:NAD(P)H dehydrogenase (quinone)
MLAVTGSTGKLGGMVAARLARLGVAQRLIVRDPKRAPQLPGAEVVQASAYGDAVAMGRALTGVDTLFLVSAHSQFEVAQYTAEKETVRRYSRIQQQITAVDAAAAVGVQHLVCLSFMSAAPDATFILARDHYYAEEHVRALGVPFTFLRMSLYTDHVPLAVSNDDVIRVPAGLGRAAWVTRSDIADVVVAVLTGSGHEGRTYDVTGPEALTMAETAERLSFATGRRMTYQPQTPHEARVSRTTSRLDRLEAERRALTGGGLSDDEVEGLITHFMQIATGELATVSDTVPKLTGHPAQSLAEYLHEHPESYQHLLTA